MYPMMMKDSGFQSSTYIDRLYNARRLLSTLRCFPDSLWVCDYYSMTIHTHGQPTRRPVCEHKPSSLTFFFFRPLFRWTALLLRFANTGQASYSEGKRGASSLLWTYGCECAFAFVVYDGVSLSAHGKVLEWSFFVLHRAACRLPQVHRQAGSLGLHTTRRRRAEREPTTC